MRSRILGTGSYLPAAVLTNFDLEKRMDTSDAWIRERTGIERRHIVAPGETTVDMAEHAARSALAAAGREPRAAAEELRQLLLEQLGQSYSDVKVEFKVLEDLDTIVKIGGGNMAMARFGLGVTFNPGAAKPTPPPAHTKISRP